MNVGGGLNKGPGGPPKRGGSGWGDPAALAAALELANSFKQGGKDKEFPNRKSKGPKGSSDFPGGGHAIHDRRSQHPLQLTVTS